jgi:predicted NBD/HSP70 family sugar kinase
LGFLSGLSYNTGMSKQYLAIDVGGTKIAAGLVDSKFKVTRIKVAPTSQKDLLIQIVSIIESYSGYVGIGLGVPGIVSPGGAVRKFPNIKNFRSTNLKKYLEAKFGMSVNIMNDAEAFTLAEAELVFKKFKRVFGVILGTGIGGGLVEKGRHRNMDRFLHQKLPALESQMQKYGPFKRAIETRDYVAKILPVIIQKHQPDLVVFGGSRSHLPQMQKVLDQVLSTIPHKRLKVTVGKLKYPGLVGAVIPLLKR